MAEVSLQQFVPSSVCLTCDGCCRTKEPESVWRPKFGQADKIGLAALITGGDILDEQGYVRTIQKCGEHFCRYLNRADNTCGIYTQRPFECSLYPFILSQTGGAIKVFVHLSCPYVQDHLNGLEFETYVGYLKQFFRRPEIRKFLSRNQGMLHDYSAYAPELLHLFDLDAQVQEDGLLEQKAFVESFLNQGPRPLSSFSFASLFAWNDFFDFKLEVIKDCLCIVAESAPGRFLYLPPLGTKLDASVISAAFEAIVDGGHGLAANRIENIPEILLNAFQDRQYNLYTKNPEYVYRKGDLIGLKGNAYKSQRHDCNLLAAHHNVSFEPCMDADFDACLRVYDRWVDHRAGAHREEIYLSMLQENRLVHGRLLKYRKELGLVARVLKADGDIIGYTFGFGLNEETFCVYAEVADLGLAGSAAYLFRSFCADEALKKYAFINAMDDFGMPNVTRAKAAYHPCMLVPSYSATVHEH